MKIYTKNGDEGLTSLYDNTRVAKDDIRIETNGQLDELNANLGLLKALSDDSLLKTHLDSLQSILMQIMSVVAKGKMATDCNLENVILTMEKDMDASGVNVKFDFVKPGNTVANAFWHIARTKARTAERCLWALNHQYAVPTVILKFMNRLSDWLFISAQKRNEDY